MCRSTDSVSPSFVRKRSNLSRANSSGSTTDETDASTTTDSMRKRVSFNEQVKVYPSERLSTSELGDVFYRPADYRRFRSDKCLEILDQQQLQSQLSPLTIIFHKLAGVVRMRTLRKRCQQHSSEGCRGKQLTAKDYPWMEAYYPQDESTKTTDTPALSKTRSCEHANAAVPSSEAVKDSPEVRTIQELAFFL